MQIIDVDVDANSVSIVFDCILEDGFEKCIIHKGLTITVLVYCLHMTLIQEFGDSQYAVGVISK